jgi:hypothetical protein
VQTTFCILSLGMGVESTAILVRWLTEPATRPCPLDKLIVLTAMTGDEYADTVSDMEKYILSMLRAYGVRFVQVAVMVIWKRTVSPFCQTPLTRIVSLRTATTDCLMSCARPELSLNLLASIFDKLCGIKNDP